MGIYILINVKSSTFVWQVDIIKMANNAGSGSISIDSFTVSVYTLAAGKSSVAKAAQESSDVLWKTMENPVILLIQ